MRVEILFSGGKDSGLTAILLEPFFDEIELVTFAFSKDDACQVARIGAEALGHSHRIIVFDEGVLKWALSRLILDGYPNDALDYVHARALECLARECEYVADGTRRDDRSPVMRRSDVQSLEDRLHVNYLRPLAGLGGRAIKAMASQYLEFEELSSDLHPASDFEVGLRCALSKRRGGLRAIKRIFPQNHTHTRVLRRKRDVQEIEGKEDQACQGLQSEPKGAKLGYN